MNYKRHLLFTQRANELSDARPLFLSRRSMRAGYLILPIIMVMAFTQCSKDVVQSESAILQTDNTDRKSQMKGIMALAGAPNNVNVSADFRTTYTFNEAIDLLDETLNFAYCRPGTPLENTIILSDTLIMEGATSTTVSEAEIADLFDEASDNLGAQYHDLSLTNKQPWVFSVKQFGNLENDDLPIIIQFEVAYGGYISDDIEYDENDDYSYESQGGMCNTSPGPGAPEVFRNNLKYNYVTSSYKYYYKPYYLRTCNVINGDAEICDGNGLPSNLFNEQARYLNQYVDAPQNWDNINDWKFFRQVSGISSNYDLCLSGDEEMPFNENYMGGIIEFYDPSTYHHPGNIWVGSNGVTHVMSGSFIPFHNMIVAYYFIALLDPNDPNDDPIELPDPCIEC